ncbi:MAG: asparagine synthase (glutamine-hydrolyzing) [Lachnospiraceae bacterium]|nr:asparagine synthase (glutamine-hydrolyzing) [Lachnospiraceae bacterium]
MCGICGFVGETDNAEAVLSGMMQKIIHRGPDSEGKFVDGPVAIGFRRLSIIDLNNGSQPMFNEDGSIVVTMNGEIYNYKEIREDLISKGHTFANNSDTEVLVHGYEEYGQNLTDHLRGMFAFVIWDKNKNEMFGARDFFGIKPFYYSLSDNHFIYASEIKSILEHPAYHKEFNEDALEAYLSFQYSALPETFFKGIFKLPPAHSFVYKDGKFETRRYWTPEFEEDKGISVKDTIDRLDKALADSVKYHMISDVEVGSLLSSGVDSSFVVSRFNGAKTFTVGFSKDNHNELGYAKRFAERMNISNERKSISSEEYFSVLDKVQYYMDEPLADASCVALYLVDELAARRVKVVLSGEGADELFGGYNIYHEPKSLAGFKLLPRGLKQSLRKKLVKSKKNFKGKNFLIRGCTPLERRFIGNANRFSQTEIKRFLKKDNVGESNFPYSVTAPIYKDAKGSDFAKMQLIDINLWLVGDILLKADKMSMAHSLESRVPFLDKEVFETARHIPAEHKIHHNVTKYAFREVAKQYIPQDVAGKKKLGFPVPLARWIKEDTYYNDIKKAFNSKTAEKFFELDFINALLERHREGASDESKKIWVIYMFLVWYEIYFNNKEITLN